MSMLDQLLNSFLKPRANTRTLSESEAIVEDKHTFHLLFPDTPYQFKSESTSSPSPASPVHPTTNFANNDCNPLNIDLESPRDVRIVVAQEESGSLPTVLYDSKPPGRNRPNPQLNRAGGHGLYSRGTSGSMGHARKSSGGLAEPPSRRGSVGSSFGRHARISSMNSMPNIDEAGRTRHQVMDKDLKHALECMFENDSLAYKGPSTRIQFAPLDDDENEEAVNNPMSVDGFGSFGRAARSRRKSSLAQSCSATDYPRVSMPRSPTGPQKERRRTVLVYRTFSVALPTHQRETVKSQSEGIVGMPPNTQARQDLMASADSSSAQIKGPVKEETASASFLSQTEVKQELASPNNTSPATTQERTRRDSKSKSPDHPTAPFDATILAQPGFVTDSAASKLPEALSNRRTENVPRKPTTGVPRARVKPEYTATPDGSTPTPSTSMSDHTSRFPFPAPSGLTPVFKLPQIAVTLIISLPFSRPSNFESSPRNQNIPRSGTQAEHSFLSSSVDSDRYGGWTFIDPITEAQPFVSDVDDHVDLLGQHWDVVARTLMSLQLVVQESMIGWLRKHKSHVFSPQSPLSLAMLSPSQLQYVYRNKPLSVRLERFALEPDEAIKHAVELAGFRLVRGIKIFRVWTGQGRWDIWCQEAAQLHSFAGAREQHHFLYNLMTGFLGSHTQWLNVFGPKRYRKRHQEQQRKPFANEDLTMTNRTVIISPDKLVARRLVFFLSAFLPASHPSQSQDGVLMSRPGTSASLRGYSQSPPANGYLSRQESLRRTISRRENAKGSPPKPQLSRKPVPQHTRASTSRDGVQQPPRLYGGNHSRRPSDTRFILRSGLMATLEADPATRKSATTIFTASPQAIASFSAVTSPTKATFDTTATLSRPGSSSSLASDLRHTLQRNNSNNSATDSSSKWGSFKSMWSLPSRRESSTDLSDVLQYPDEGLGVATIPSLSASRSKLQRMVDEANHGVDGELFAEDLEDRTPAVSPPAEEVETPALSSFTISSSQTESTQNNTQPSLSSPPLKVSVNEKDGVIDVEIPGFSFGFGSPSDSFLLGKDSNVPSSLESSSVGLQSTCEFLNRDNKETKPASVCGWLTWFHPDFILQAVNPYDGLEERIKTAMSAEPTPTQTVMEIDLSQGPRDTWVDVCSTIMADTRTFSVKQLLLRRLVRLIPASAAAHQPPTPGVYHPSTMKSKWGDVYDKSDIQPTELRVKEEFIEETINECDADLMKAVEKALASCAPAPAMEPPIDHSEPPRGRTEGDTTKDKDEPSTKVEGAKQKARCKEIILGSLDQIAHDVLAEQRIQQDDKDASKTNETKPKQYHRRSTGKDNVLRGGIRRWLKEAEV